jgi:hypothetical protein
MSKLNASMLTHATSILKYLNVYLSRLHNKYIAVPADKTPNNIVLCGKSHYISCMTKEECIDNSLANAAYTVHRRQL